jgi:hypothetical protein
VLLTAEIRVSEYDAIADRTNIFDVFWAALYSVSDGMQDDRYIAARPGDDQGAIAWSGGLAPYADWLPRRLDEALSSAPQIAVYGDDRNASFETNQTSDRREVALSPSVNRTRGDHTTEFLEVAAGLDVAYAVDGKDTGNVTLLWSRADFTTLVSGLFVYGYLDDGFDELPLALSDLYADPTLSSYGSLVFTRPETIAIGRNVPSRSVLETNYQHHTFSLSQYKVVP